MDKLYASTDPVGVCSELVLAVLNTNVCKFISMTDNGSGKGCISKVGNGETDQSYQLLYPGSCVPRSKSRSLESSLTHLNPQAPKPKRNRRVDAFQFFSLPRIDDNREGNDTPAREPHGL